MINHKGNGKVGAQLLRYSNFLKLLIILNSLFPQKKIIVIHTFLNFLFKLLIQFLCYHLQVLEKLQLWLKLWEKVLMQTYILHLQLKLLLMLLKFNYNLNFPVKENLETLLWFLHLEKNLYILLMIYQCQKYNNMGLSPQYKCSD